MSTVRPIGARSKAAAPPDPGAAAFDVIAEQARELDEQAAPPAPPEAPAAAAPEPVATAPPAPPSDSAELFEALDLARVAVEPMFDWWPAYRPTWSDHALHRIADAGAAVMQRHGWTMGGLLNEYAPYIALALATAPPALTTYRAIEQHRRELAAPKTPNDRSPSPPTPPTPEPNQ
jgi:hypothetical protein